MKKNTKRAAVVLAALGLSIAGGSAAYSYWTTPGSGTGTAATGNVVAVTIKATSPAVTGLYPGGPTQNISGNFDNPNAGKVYISRVTVAISGISGSGTDLAKPTCTSADYTLTQPAVTNAEIAAGTGVGAWGPGTVAMANTATNQDNCKGATVNLTFTSN